MMQPHNLQGFPNLKITIVTVNLNNEAGLSKTIESVITQSYSNIEYIIIDGGSNDKSVPVIKSHEPNLSFWVSEKDCGIYNAMNKGLLNATGDYILFLNSGDYLSNAWVIETVVQKTSDLDVVYGDIGILQNGRIKMLRSADKLHYYQKYQHNLPPHPAIFMKREFLRKLGGFDERYKIVADVVVVSRAFSRKDTSYKHLNLLVTIFDTTGVSSDEGKAEQIYCERKAFLVEQFPQYLSSLERVYRPTIFQKVTNRLAKVNLKKYLHLLSLTIFINTINLL